MYKVARFIEFIAFVLEDIAERIDIEGATDEAKKQFKIERTNLTQR